MHVIRRNAKQGHAIPSTASAPLGPFPYEIMVQSQIVIDNNDPDFLYPPNATAQNNYAPPKIFRCTYCEELVHEYETEFHKCEEYDEREEDEDG